MVIVWYRGWCVLPYKRIDSHHQSTYRNLINYGNTSLLLIFLKRYCYTALFTTRYRFDHNNHSRRLESMFIYSLLESHEATEAPPAEWIWNKRYGEFRTWGWSLSANIWLGRGYRPPTTVGVKRLEWLLYRVVSKYPQSTIYYCHNTCIWRTDRRTDRIATAISWLALHAVTQ